MRRSLPSPEIFHLIGSPSGRKLTLEHVVKYNAEIEKAGITDGRVAPAIIPDYTEEQVRERQLTSNYVGNVR